VFGLVRGEVPVAMLHLVGAEGRCDRLGAVSYGRVFDMGQLERL